MDEPHLPGDDAAGDRALTDGGVPNDGPRSGGAYVCEALVDAGVSLVVGLPGTQTLPLDRAVAERDDVEYVMARHETAVPHVAWGYYEACGRPAATVTVPGPGDTNAMHGLKNAAEDSVPILHVAADADPEDRGKGPIHELDPETFDHVVKGNFSVERPMELRGTVAEAVELALTPPYGPVRVGVPKGVLAAEFDAPAASAEPARTTYDNADAYDRAADLLASAERPALVVGGGCRRAEGGPAAVAGLADALDAPVAVTYKGKGVYPEDDSRFLGTAGSHLPAGAREVLERADVVCALGTDLDGVTTAHWTLPTGDDLVHVNLNPDDVGRSYEPTVALVDDAAAACDRLRDGVDARGRADGWDGGALASRVREEYDAHLRESGCLGGGDGADSADDNPTTSAALLRAVREAVPREAVVTADVGGFRLWAMQTFEAYAPDRFVAAGSWAGMGVGLPAAVGAKLARPDAPVVCLSGDGGLLMCIHELNTAADRDLDVTLVVCTNADYGIISNAPERGDRRDDRRFDWESPDFVTVAEGFGWTATRADTPAEAADAVADALDAEGPTLVDVPVDPREPTAAEAADYDTAVGDLLASDDA
ncbi:thiamine pyrophosphate-binding protein [Candidatus Halobonum tyrrellensis]|uniref:Thiamine pyrophosphate protein domain protein TPP-binding protein n=1 Tax=Candidatus Halobonum tyrrellensis G22 TaxID=1324957 RepID=V4HK78_9EURY|nr:thiamine pyrophosphate-binding protein [Candidatus Halobonum tyrrellensis]ESP90193.1 thiamine pyrophosphate protein domain protein TPP-binding protein [Candidatus Halobonum tyrrellensis G22]